VGVRVFAFTVVLCVMVSTMSIPLVHSDDDDYRYLSYKEKQERELERLLDEYELKEPDEGGPPVVELLDFNKVHQDELEELNQELSDHSKLVSTRVSNIETQNEIIGKEEQKLVQAQQLVQKDWSAPKPDNSRLVSEYQILEIMTKELQELLVEKKKMESHINVKELLIEILKHDAKLIGIEIGANCIAMAKLNMTSCPTYEELYYLDSSITEVSGEFSHHDGYFHREKTGYQDSFRAYDHSDKIRILVDPPQNEGIRIKMITIEPNIGLYTDKGFTTKITDGKRVMGNERIIKDCTTAKISADNWKMLLPDTIHTFRNGCESAEIEDLIEFDMPKTEIDIWSSPNVQYAEWLLKIKQTCKVKC
jgi:uncharacterized protein YlaN (UPF0358 family)